jgi:hypothetical protein
MRICRSLHSGCLHSSCRWQHSFRLNRRSLHSLGRFCIMPLQTTKALSRGLFLLKPAYQTQWCSRGRIWLRVSPSPSSVTLPLAKHLRLNRWRFIHRTHKAKTPHMAGFILCSRGRIYLHLAYSVRFPPSSCYQQLDYG